MTYNHCFVVACFICRAMLKVQIFILSNQNLTEFQIDKKGHQLLSISLLDVLLVSQCISTFLLLNLP